jgi:hypothetical protein
MLRYNMVVIALGSMAMAAVVPREAADAQSGQALVFAEHACLEYGVTPRTASFESCVERASLAFDRGEPDVAYTQARMTRDARQACQSYGIEPDMAGHGQCVAAQVERRTRRWIATVGLTAAS